MRRIIAISVAVLLTGAAHPPAAPCKCRARGVTATLGQTLCIPTPNGPRLARCDMVLNNTSWTFLSGPCPQATLDLLLEESGSRYPQSAVRGGVAGG